MNKRYTLENKPTFRNGEMVDIDMRCFGFSPGIERGRIVGKSVTNVVDHWLVEFDHDFSPTYPYKVVSVQHTFILQK